ncbi:hypothetical protein A9Q83_12065 [Alphaproteobacteria bacterium 46_93_T64]|nr:hypothetical protein A9Q83_12065 [Alphaproteobacteria bacterium 46_93_T64]
MRYLFLVLVLIPFFVFPTLAQSQSLRELQFACAVFPPFNTDNKEEPGITQEVLAAALKTVNRSVKFHTFPFKRALEITKYGKVDALCGCSYTAERENSFHYSDMLGILHQGIFVSSNYSGKKIRTLKDLGDIQVGTVRGYATERELEKLGMKVMSFVDSKQLALMLLTGRIDAIYAYKNVILYELKKLNSKTKFAYYNLSSQPYYTCISKAITNPYALLRDLNQGLRVVRSNGIYQGIWNKYSSQE